MVSEERCRDFILERAGIGSLSERERLKRIEAGLIVRYRQETFSLAGLIGRLERLCLSYSAYEQLGVQLDPDVPLKSAAGTPPARLSARRDFQERTQKTKRTFTCRCCSCKLFLCPLSRFRPFPSPLVCCGAMPMRQHRIDEKTKKIDSPIDIRRIVWYNIIQKNVHVNGGA